MKLIRNRSWHLPGATGLQWSRIFHAPLIEWFYVLWLGLAALFGQYFVTNAYGADKAGVVSAIGYANIFFSIFIGMALGDAFPDLMSLAGILCIILSGVMISLEKRRRI